MGMNIASYIGNLGKSVAYSAVDKFQEMSPATTELVQTNSDLFKEVYSNIRDYKNTYRRVGDSFKQSKIYEASDLFFTSIFEDIKSGSLYNKERIDKIESKLMGADSFQSDMGVDDSQFDMNFDDSDFNLDSKDEILVSSIDKSSERNAEMISTTIARTGKYIVESQKTSSHILYTQNLEAYNLFNHNLTNINTNLSNMVTFSNQTIQTHAENSKKFFEESTKFQNQQTELLKQIVNILSGGNSVQEKEKKKKITIDDILGSNGTPDMREYIKYVKQNFNNQYGHLMPQTGMGGDDANNLLLLVSSPLKAIPDFIINKMVPDALEESFKRFDKSLSGFFGSIISKFNDMGEKDNPIISAIGKLFGISSSVKSDLDTSNYNKGKVDWDGKSRKALIEVIPTYLSKILSVLSGKGEYRYDYEEGKFLDAKSIKDNLDKRKNMYQKSATSDMREQFSYVVENLMKFNSLDDKESLNKDIDTFFKALYDKGGFFDINSKTIEEDHTKYNVSAKNFRAIRSMFKNAPRYLQQQINKDILEQRSKANKDMISLEESGTSIFSNLFNDSNIDEYVDRDKKTGEIKSGSGLLGGLNLVKTKDNLGHNIFYYLQNMYRELNFIRRSGGVGSGSIDIPGITMSDGTYHKDELDFDKDTRIKDKSELSKKAKQEREDRERQERNFLKQQEKRLEKKETERQLLIDYSKIDDEKALEARIGASIDIDQLNKKLDKNKDKEPSLIDKLIESKNITDKTKTIIDKLNDLSKKPVEFLTNTLDKVDERLYQAIYGDIKYKGTDVKGFLNVIIYEIKNTFTKFNDWIDEKILKPMREKFEVDNMKDLGKRVFKNLFGVDFDDITKSIRTYFLGDKETGEKGIFSSVGEGIKDSFKGAFTTIKDSVKEAILPVKNKYNELKGRIPKKNKETGEIEYVEPEDSLVSIINNVVSENDKKGHKVLSEKDDKEYQKLFKKSYMEDMIKQYEEKYDIEKQKDKLGKTKKELDTILDIITNPNNKLIPKKMQGFYDDLYNKKEEVYNKQQKEFDEYSKNKKVIDRYNRFKGKIDLRDLYKTEYSDKFYKLLGLDSDDDKSLLSEMFNKSIDLKNMDSFSIKDIQNKFKGEDKYSNILQLIGQYSKMFSTGENTTFDHIIKNNMPFPKKEKESLTIEEAMQSAFVQNTNANLDQSNSLLGKIESGISNIYTFLKDTFGKKDKKSDIKKDIKSNYNNFTDPGNREEKVVDKFANNINDYIKGMIEPRAKGTKGAGFVEDSDKIVSIQKGELVLDKDDTKNFSKVLDYLVKKIGSGKNVKDILSDTPDTVSNFISNSKLTIEDIKNSKEGQSIIDNISKMDKSGIDVLKKALVELKKKELKGTEEGQSLVEKTASEIYNNTMKTKSILFGNDKKDSKAFGEVVDDLTHNISKYAPEAVGSGLVGAGVSLISGAIGGPLLGAAVGAGISLTKNSEKIQKWLFGDKIGDTDERSGGLVSKNTINTLKKYLPDMKTFGITGGVAGLLPFLPFGPVGGVLLGSAFGFAKNTNVVQERMFGKAGVLNDKRRDEIKKFLPKAAAAMVPSLFFGPFGLLGNAVLGSALGILSNTTGFNDFLYGKFNKTTEQYENGVLPAIRDNITNPIQKFFTKLTDRGFDWIEEHIAKPIETAIAPLGKQIEVMFSSMINGVGKFINNMFEKSVGVPLGKFVEDKLIKPFTFIFGKLFKVMTAPAKFLISSPFKAIGALGEAARKRQIRKGNATYMSAEERNKYRKDKKGLNGLFATDKYSQFDTMLENLSDDNVSEIYDKLNLVYNTDKALKEKRYNLKYEIGNEVTGYLGKYSNSKKAMTDILNGYPDSAKQYVLDKRTKDKKLDTQILNKLNDFINNKVDGELVNTNKLLDYIYKRIDDPKLVRKLTKLIRQEKYKEVMEIIEKKMEEDDKKEKNIINFINNKSIEYSKLDGSKSDIEELIKGNYKDLERVGFGNLKPKDAEKILSLLKSEKEHREKKVIEESDIRVLDKTPEEIEKEKKQEFYKPILHFLEDIVDGIDSIKKSYEEIANINKMNLPNIDDDVTNLHNTSNKYKKISIKTNNTKKNLENSIDRYTNPEAYERQKREQEELDKQGVIAPAFAKGGMLNKTGIFAGSKGEVILTPENVNKLIDNTVNENTVIPDILEETNKDEEKRHEGIISLFNKVIEKLDFAFPKKDKKKKVTRVDGQGNPLDYIITSDGEEELDLSDAGNRKVIKENEENKKLQQGIFDRLGSMIDLFHKDKSGEDSDKKENKFAWIDNLIHGLKKAGLIAAGTAALGASAQIIEKYIMPKAKEEWEKNWKPWLDNTFLPWVEDKAIPTIAGKMKDGLKLALTEGMPLIVHGVAESVKFAVTEMYPALLKAVLNEMGLSGKHGEESLPGNVAYAAGRDVLTQSGRFSSLAQKITNIKPKTRNVMDIVKNPIKGTMVAAGDLTMSAGKIATKGLGKVVEKVSTPINKLYQGIDSVKLFGKAPSLKQVSNKSANIGETITKSMSGAIKKRAEKLGWSSIAKTTEDAALNSSASKGVLKSLISGLQSFILKLVKAKPVMTLVGEDGAEKIVNQFMPKFLDALSVNIEKSGLKISGKLAASISTAGLANIAFSITGFVSGYNDCKDILEILEEPTFGMRLATGLLRAISGFFIVTAIIPEKIYTDLVLDLILPIFGYEYTELQKMRERAKKQVEEHNKVYKTNYNVEQYNKEVGGHKTLWQKTQKWVTEKMTKAGEKINTIYNDIQEIDKFMLTDDESIKKLLDSDSEDSYWAMPQIDQDNKTAPFKSFFFYTNRVLMAPYYYMNKLGKGIKKGANDFYYNFLAIDYFMNNDDTVIQSLLNNPEGGSYWTMPEEESKTSVPFKSFFFYTNRVLMAPYYYMNKLGQSIKNGAANLYEGFLSIGSFLDTDDNAIENLLNNPEGGSYWSMPEEDNSVTAPFKSFFFYTNRVIMAPYYYMNKLGKGIKSIGQKIVDGYKSINDFIDQDSNDIQKELDGNGSGNYWDLKTDDSSPLKSILFYTNRIMNAPMYYMKRLFKNFSGDSFISKIKNFFNIGNGPSPINSGNGEEDKKSKRKDMKDGGLGASSANGMVYYSQGDPDWSSLPYGTTGTLGSSACGPTSAAMVISSLTGNKITPVEAAKYSTDNGFRIPGVGTSWEYFNSIGQKYGINFQQTTDKNSIINALNNNQPVIFSGKGAAPFTKGGHFIVGAGLDGNNIKVNDPVSLARSKAYPSSQIFNDMATAFIANKPLSGMPMASNTNNTTTTTQPEKPSIFNMTSEFGNMINNTFDKLYGFGIGDGDNSKFKKLVEYIDTKKNPKLAFGGGKEDFYNRDLTKFTMPSEADLNAWIKKQNPSSPFVGNAKIFIQAAQKTGLDPRYIVAHAALESGWGKATLGKNNYFGIGAFNSSPQASALKFAGGMEQGIIGGAQWIKDNFVSGGQNSLYKMLYGKPGHSYATLDDEKTPNKQWMEQIASIMSSAPQDGQAFDASSISGSSSGQSSQESQKPSIFNMISDFGNMLSDSFNRLYGFDTSSSSESSTATGIPSSIDTNTSDIANGWFTKTLGAQVTSKFGPRVVNGQPGTHKGIDYGVASGTPIKSPVEGKVIQNSFDNGGYGNYIVIEDKNKYHHYFGHMNSKSPLSVGSTVKVGDIIGNVGSTGRSTGPHLHYEVRDSKDSNSIDPNKYLNTLYKGSSVQTGGSKPKLQIPYDNKRVGGDETDASTKKISNNNSISTQLIEKLITTVIEILSKIADNTSNLSEIVKLLSDTMNVKIPEEKLKNINKDNTKIQLLSVLKDAVKNNSSDMSNSYLIDTLNRIATE